MKRLDIAAGEWVRLRDGGYAKIIEHSENYISYTEAALNGFNNVLWWEPYQDVRPDGRKRDIPSACDIVGFVKWKSGFLAEKPIQTEPRYI